MDASAEVKADVRISPERSQTFIVLMVILTGISFVASLIFLWHKPELSVVPFIATAVFFSVTSVAWFRSHKNVDMHGAAPTSISADPNGQILVTTDARVLINSQSQLALSGLVASVAYRKPLPTPSGMVTDVGIPLPNSEEHAAQTVAVINSEISLMSEQVFGTTVGNAEACLIEQIPSISRSASPPENFQ